MLKTSHVSWLGFLGAISARDGEHSLNLRVGRRSASRPPCDALGIAHGDGELVPGRPSVVRARHPQREHAGVRGRTLAGVADEAILVDVTFRMLPRRIAGLLRNGQTRIAYSAQSRCEGGSVTVRVTTLIGAATNVLKTPSGLAT